MARNRNSVARTQEVGEGMELSVRVWNVPLGLCTEVFFPCLVLLRLSINAIGRRSRLQDGLCHWACPLKGTMVLQSNFLWTETFYPAERLIRIQEANNPRLRKPLKFRGLLKPLPLQGYISCNGCWAKGTLQPVQLPCITESTRDVVSMSHHYSWEGFSVMHLLLTTPCSSKWL